MFLVILPLYQLVESVLQELYITLHKGKGKCSQSLQTYLTCIYISNTLRHANILLNSKYVTGSIPLQIPAKTWIS